MTRRLALACSFALTVVVSFAVASLGMQAGWFSDTSPVAAENATVDVSPTPTTAPSAIVIDETVFVDIPASQAPVQQTTAAPAPLQPTPQAFSDDSRHRSGHDDDDRDDDDDDDRRDHADDDDDRRGHDDDDDDRHSDDD